MSDQRNLTHESLQSLSRIVSCQQNRIADQNALIQKQGARCLALALENHVLRNDAAGFLEDEITRHCDGFLAYEDWIVNHLNYGRDEVPVGDLLRHLADVAEYADHGVIAPWIACWLARHECEEGESA